MMVDLASLVALNLLRVVASEDSSTVDATAFACRQLDGRTVLAPVGESRGAGGLEAGQCQLVKLPIPFASIRWSAWLPVSPGSDLNTIALAGAGRKEAFVPTAARLGSPKDGPPRPGLLPMGRGLLSHLSARPFGVEERVGIVRTDGAIVVSCREGSEPAGVVLDPVARRLPGNIRLRLRWEARDGAAFSIGISPRHGTPSSLVPLSMSESIVLPADLRSPDAPWFVITCPNEPGRLDLMDLRLVPEGVADGPVPKAAWAWKPALWRDHPDALLRRARDFGLTRLFVAVEIVGDELKDAAAFARFVARARAVGVEVAVAEGDPAMALEAGRAKALRRLRVLVDHQRHTEASGQIAGVQYDIEPYLLPAYASDPQKVLQGWAETVEALGAVATALELDVVLPFWLAEDELAAKHVLPKVGAWADRVTVMAYRTAEEEVQAAAEPLLAWAAELGLPIHVALEAGPVEEETTRVYGRAAEGDLWVLPQKAGTLIVLLDRPRRGGPLVFAMSHENTVPPSRVSFLGDGERLRRVLETVSPVLRAWPSFAGFALHGVTE